MVNIIAAAILRPALPAAGLLRAFSGEPYS
jgi:hypothetical protein